MGRAIGKINPFPANFEIVYNQPIDARTVIPYFTGLTDNTTIPFPYSGMVVSVVNDSTEKNGLYFLKKPDAEGQPFASNLSEWIKIGGDSITGNTWTYSSDTLNLQMSTGGTIPLTGFTFVNTTGDTIFGKLTISADTNPINLSGLTATTSALTVNTKFLSLDSNNNVIIQTGITVTSSLSGGVTNYLSKWTGTSAITTTLLRTTEDGSKLAIGLPSGDTISYPLMISADTNPISIKGIVNNSFDSLNKYLYVDSSGVINSSYVTQQTGITVYISARTNSGQVDFIQTGTPENIRSVYYNYHLKSLQSYSIRSGTLQAVWGTGATADLNYTDQGPLQIIEGTNTISGINVSGVTGGVSVVIEVANGNWEFKAYRVKL